LVFIRENVEIDIYIYNNFVHFNIGDSNIINLFYKFDGSVAIAAKLLVNVTNSDNNENLL